MALYRIGQGLRALTAYTRPVDIDLARAYLSPPLLALFAQMRRSEQQHSLCVLRALRAAGHTDPDLMTAALIASDSPLMSGGVCSRRPTLPATWALTGYSQNT